MPFCRPLDAVPCVILSTLCLTHCLPVDDRNVQLSDPAGERSAIVSGESLSDAGNTPGVATPTDCREASCVSPGPLDSAPARRQSQSTAARREPSAPMPAPGASFKELAFPPPRRTLPMSAVSAIQRATLTPGLPTTTWSATMARFVRSKTFARRESAPVSPGSAMMESPATVSRRVTRRPTHVRGRRTSVGPTGSAMRRAGIA